MHSIVPLQPGIFASTSTMRVLERSIVFLRILRFVFVKLRVYFWARFDLRLFNRDAVVVTRNQMTKIRVRVSIQIYGTVMSPLLAAWGAVNVPI